MPFENNNDYLKNGSFVAAAAARDEDSLWNDVFLPNSDSFEANFILPKPILQTVNALSADLVKVTKAASKGKFAQLCDLDQVALAKDFVEFSEQEKGWIKNRMRGLPKATLAAVDTDESLADKAFDFDSLKVVISRDPAVLAAATCQRHCALERNLLSTEDVRRGVLVASLVSREDLDGAHPLMQAVLVPYECSAGERYGKDRVLVASRVYGVVDATNKAGMRQSFKSVVDDFLTIVNKGKAGLFRRDADLYQEQSMPKKAYVNPPADVPELKGLVRSYFLDEQVRLLDSLQPSNMIKPRELDVKRRCDFLMQPEGLAEAFFDAARRVSPGHYMSFNLLKVVSKTVLQDLNALNAYGKAVKSVPLSKRYRPRKAFLA